MIDGAVLRGPDKDRREDSCVACPVSIIMTKLQAFVQKVANRVPPFGMQCGIS